MRYFFGFLMVILSININTYFNIVRYVSIINRMDTIQTNMDRILQLFHPDTELNDSVLYDYLVVINVMFPDIVLSQAKLESSNYNSSLYRSNKNLFGMKLAYKRATIGKTAKDINDWNNGISGRNKNGYAHYETWRESVLDYALYQMRFCGKMNREEYLNYLGKNYAEIRDYRIRIETIAKQLNIKKDW